MSERPALGARAAHASALADAVLADPAASVALDEVVHLTLMHTGADAGQLSMMTDQLVSVCPSGLFDGVVEPGDAFPFEETLCAQVLRAGDTVAIPDASADQRVAGVPAVARGEWSAYLGAPVRTRHGDLVAVLCVFHRTPRDWTAAEQAEMHALAERAGHILDASELTAAGGH